MEIKRMFVHGTAFIRGWKSLGLDDGDLRRLEKELLQNPKAGDVISGTGHLRKIRFAFAHSGKRGSARVCYVDFEAKEKIYLLAIFAKSERENLSHAERNILRKKIIALEASL